MNIAVIAFFSAFLTGFNPDCQTVTAGLDISTSNTTVINQCAFIINIFMKVIQLILMQVYDLLIKKLI